MSFLPIVSLELRQAARRARTYWMRAGAVILAIIIGFGVLTPSFHGVVVPTETGRALFFILTIVSYVLALLSGAFLTADCLSQEKRDGTLGLLFLTDLRGYDVVFGKLMSRSLAAVYAMLGIFPILAISIVIGGVTFGEFARATAALLSQLALSLAVGMVVSSMSREGIRATGATLLINLALAAVPWLLANFGTNVAAGNYSPVLMISPAFLFWLIQESSYLVAPAGYFGTALFLQLTVASCLLITASVWLPLHWQELPTGRKKRDWGARWREWNRGDVLRNEEYRRTTLDRAPLEWLSHRQRYSYAGLLVWGLLVCAVWIFGWFALSTYWRNAETVLLTSFALHVLIKVWVATEICRRVDEAKRNGALELLLVTPCSAAAIIRSLLAATKRQFLGPIGIALIVDVFLMFLAQQARSSVMGMKNLVPALFGGMALFISDTYALTWVGLWRACAASTAHRAFSQTFMAVMVLPWFVMLAAGAALVVVLGQGIALGALVALWFGAGYFTDLLLCAIAINSLSVDFNKLVSETGGKEWQVRSWFKKISDPPGEARESIV